MRRMMLRSTSVSGGFDADYQNLLNFYTSNGLEIPNNEVKNIQNELIINLKNENIWQSLDCFSVFATGTNNQANTLVDWKRLVIQTEEGNGLFNYNPKTGLKGNLSRIINTVYNPFSQAVNFSLNNASMGVWLSELASTITRVMGNSPSNLKIQTNADQRINGSALFGQTIPQIGLLHIDRENSTTRKNYQNGALVTNATNNSTLIEDNNMFIFATTNLSASIPTDARLAFAFVGASLSLKATELYNSINNYYTQLQSITIWKN